jgi:hypothetical protein
MADEILPKTVDIISDSTTLRELMLKMAMEKTHYVELSVHGVTLCAAITLRPERVVQIRESMSRIIGRKR